jgi:hypothetical protein
MKNNIVTSLVLTSLYILMNAAFANAANTPTAETTLLVNAISLQGEDLPANQLQQKLSAEIQNYAQLTADETPEARVMNLQTALTDLSISTSSQAAVIAENVRVALNSTSGTSADQLANQLAPVLAGASSGAQFSACVDSLIALGIGSAIAAPLAYLQNTDHNSLTYGTIAGILVLIPLFDVMFGC